jgi:hypothetical protein
MLSRVKNGGCQTSNVSFPNDVSSEIDFPSLTNVVNFELWFSCDVTNDVLFSFVVSNDA